MDFAVGAAETVDAADALGALQCALHGVVHKPRQLFQRHVGRGDGVGLDRLTFDVDLRDLGVVDRGGKRAADAVDRVLDVLERLIGRNFDVEDHRSCRQAVGDVRLDVVDAGYAGDRVFDDLGDLTFKLGGRRTALADGHRDDRHVDIRETRDGQLVESLNAHEEQQEKRQQGCYGIADRPG